MHKCHYSYSYLVSEVLTWDVNLQWLTSWTAHAIAHSFCCPPESLSERPIPLQWSSYHGRNIFGTRRHLKSLQPGPGSKSADPFQMHPWTMHQNSAAASSSVGMGLGPRVGLCQCRPEWTRQIDLCDVWPTLTPVCGQAGWTVSHSWCPPVLWSEISLFMLGRGDASSSRVTDHYSD